MNKKIFLLSIILSLLIGETQISYAAEEVSPSSTPVPSTTEAAAGVVPLYQLDMIGRLSQSIGLSTDAIQAELDSGKTLLQIAEENGMPATVFQSRVVKADFSVASAAKKGHAKKTSKVKQKKKIHKKSVKKAVHKTKSSLR